MKMYLTLWALACCMALYFLPSLPVFALNISTTTAEILAPISDFAETNPPEHAITPVWLVIPFIALLLMIATGPLFYEHFWHRHYPKIAIGLGVLVVMYYLLVLHNHHQPVHAMMEYIQFISLLTALFVASGGILIQVDRRSTPLANVGLLLTGAVLSNLIGTTGASMLLIRPYIRMNKGHIQAYHIVFFIFMISNAGGLLTPIGDPPLFLGFLKGVPFFWTLENNLAPWALALGFLALVFYLVDKRYGNTESLTSLYEPIYTNQIAISGKKNFLWLSLIIIAVFLDPNVMDWVPAISYGGQKISFLREIIMLSVAFLSYRFADPKALKGNEFTFEPIREVAFIFVGIFATMMPALELAGIFAKSPGGAALINHNTLYWGTGALSAVLDNAPTYLNFLAAAMASRGVDITQVDQVRNFALNPESSFELLAISVASVLFGAMTYIGNGPNFMVKSIAEQNGIKMPSFFGYVIRFSLPILLPILLLIWIVFFALA